MPLALAIIALLSVCLVIRVVTNALIKKKMINKNINSKSTLGNIFPSNHYSVAPVNKWITYPSFLLNSINEEYGAENPHDCENS